MNINETQTFLTMLWSLFPNAPKCDADSKKAMIAAWFYVLHEYTLNDVWEGSQRVLRDKPSFIPNAFEILASCKKTVNPDAFLDSEYYDLEQKFTGSTHIYQQSCDYDYEIKRLLDERNSADAGRAEEIDELIRQNIEQRSIEARLDDLFMTAQIAAEKAYSDKEFTKYAGDLKALGFTENLSLSGV